jgi:hypothetical protein
LGVTFAAKGLTELWKDTYVCSISSRTIVYKGMVRGCPVVVLSLQADVPGPIQVRSVVLKEFYPDLKDPR